MVCSPLKSLNRFSCYMAKIYVFIKSYPVKRRVARKKRVTYFSFLRRKIKKWPCLCAMTIYYLPIKRNIANNERTLSAGRFMLRICHYFLRQTIMEACMCIWLLLRSEKILTMRTQQLNPMIQQH